MTWPEPVERVARVLRDARVEARVEEFRDGTSSAEDAARAVGCTPAQIVKSLVFLANGRALLVLVPGDRRADRAKVAAAAGSARVRVAGPEEVRRATGFTAGGVAPFGLREPHEVLVDPSVLTHELVWTGAGSPRHVAALAPADLVRLTRARAVDVVADD